MNHNPQKENGYTPIANEILEALGGFRVSGECWQILVIIWRKTYGYQKKQDKISNSQFVQLTGLKKGNVSRALSKLITSNIVIKIDNNHGGIPEYGFNKKYKEWNQTVIKIDNKRISEKLLSKKKPLLSKTITKVINIDNKPLSKLMDTKERKKKEIIQKKGDFSEKIQTPKDRTKEFFKGVEDMQKKIEDKEFPETTEMEKLKKFLTGLMLKYPDVDKKSLWDEILKFQRYWTELNHTGNKERWQQQATFMVERRLVTWLGNKNSFKNVAKDYKVENF